LCYLDHSSHLEEARALKEEDTQTQGSEKRKGKTDLDGSTKRHFAVALAEVQVPLEKKNPIVRGRVA
jgi:hypothetical protein